MTNIPSTGPLANLASSNASEIETIEIEGRSLAFARAGRGTPSVILETGLGAESAEWSEVMNGVAPFSCAFRYDRAGRGASAPAPDPRDAHQIVDELHRLLEAALIPAPYLLVGQSLGGLLMRVFAQRYRSETAGLVLVDSMHDDQFDVFAPTFPAPAGSEPPSLARIREFWTGGWKNPDANAERADLFAVVRQGREVSTLGDLPLHVITAGTYLNAPWVPPGDRPKLQHLWDALQMRLVQLSSRAIHTYVPTSGHFVQRDAPKVVVDAIIQMRAQL